AVPAALGSGRGHICRCGRHPLAPRVASTGCVPDRLLRLCRGPAGQGKIMMHSVVMPIRRDHADQVLTADPEPVLVAQLQAGNEKAFETFVQRYRARLLAIAGRFLGSEEDRADAVQDAFLCAFRTLRAFEGKSQLSTWLHRIVVNVCLRKLRSNSRATVA